MEKNKYFLDTNIFLRPIVKDDEEKAEECKKLINKIKEGSIKAFTFPIVMAEIEWTTSSYYNLKKKERILILKEIKGIANLRFKEDFDLIQAIKIYQESKVEFIDALIGSMLSGLENSIIISYDTDFDKIEGVTRKEPSQLL